VTLARNLSTEPLDEHHSPTAMPHSHDLNEYSRLRFPSRGSRGCITQSAATFRLYNIYIPLRLQNYLRG